MLKVLKEKPLYKVTMNVPPELQERVAEVFRQLDDTTKECELLFRSMHNNAAAFKNVLTYCRSMKWPCEEQVDTLDASLSDGTSPGMRVSILGGTNIERYCRTNTLQTLSPSAYTAIQKTRLAEPIEIPDYHLRVNLKQETPIANPVASGWNDQSPKVFRLKKRYIIRLPGDKFRLDATLVRSSTAPAHSFANSDVMRRAPMYELELEYVGPRPLTTKSKAAAAKEMLRMASEILIAMHYDTTMTLLSASEKAAMRSNYLELVGKHEEAPDKFVGAKPVPLERHHLVPDALHQLPALLGGQRGSYAITEKADGERHLVYVDPDNRVLVFNNRMEVVAFPVTLKHGWENSLFDAEIVVTHSGVRTVLLFDCYYVRGASVVDLPLLAAVAAPGAGAGAQTQTQNSRYAYVKKFEEQASSEKDERFALRAKAYITGPDLFGNAQYVLTRAEINMMDYDIDGLIYMPIKAAAKLSGTWHQVFKWKPAHENTIDFLIRFDPDEDFIIDDDGTLYRKGLLYVGFQKSTTKITGLDFFSGAGRGRGDRGGRGGRGGRNGGNSYVAVPFYPEDAPKDISVCHIKVTETDGRKAYCTNGDLILDDTILECSFDERKNQWIPKRVRRDKTELYHQNRSLSRAVNDYMTALSVWTNVIYPVTRQHVVGAVTLTEEDVPQTAYYDRNQKGRHEFQTRPMTNFHNHWIKLRTLIGRPPVTQNRSLFDIGCGKGGDLNKWIRSGFTTVVGIDLFTNNITHPIDGVYARLENTHAYSPARHKYAFFPFDASIVIDEASIERHVPDDHRTLAKLLWGMGKAPNAELQKVVGIAKKGFDVVSCQFAMHYFFETHSKLDAFIQNVANQLVEGGFFIGTCFDGLRVHNLLRGLPNGGSVKGFKNEVPIWGIWKRYDAWDDMDPHQNIGKAIGVYMETISPKILTEYLVDFDLLRQKLAEVGIHEVESGTFEEAYHGMMAELDTLPMDIRTSVTEMSADEKTYSFLNRWFVFRKDTSATFAKPRSRPTTARKGSKAKETVKETAPATTKGRKRSVSKEK